MQCRKDIFIFFLCSHNIIISSSSSITNPDTHGNFETHSENHFRTAVQSLQIKTQAGNGL